MVVVKFASEDFAVLYVVLVAFASCCVQATYTPFKEDADDMLTLFFMVNEFLLALTMLCEQHWEEWSGGSVSGMVLVALTSAAMVYALYRAKLVGNVLKVVSVGQAYVRGRGEEVKDEAEEEEEGTAQPHQLSPATTTFVHGRSNKVVSAESK